MEIKGNCMTGCVHNKYKETYIDDNVTDENGNVIIKMKVFDGYEHYCDECPKNYKEWHERNKNNSYNVYKKDYLPCYVPNKLTKELQGMINLANEILSNIKK